MSKRATHWLSAIIILIIVGIVGFAWYNQHRANKFVQSTTPTLFFHGGGSSYHAALINSSNQPRRPCSSTVAAAATMPKSTWSMRQRRLASPRP